MRTSHFISTILIVLAIGACTSSVCARSDSIMYFSSDRTGQNRVASIREGDALYLVVVDNDKNIDSDLRDKIWADIKVFDPSTGAYIIWNPGEHLGVNIHLDPTIGPAALDLDYLEETDVDTGVFVSKRAFRVGTRESFAEETPWRHTHVVDAMAGVDGQGNVIPTDFRWGHYMYVDPTKTPNTPADTNSWLSPGPRWTPGLMPAGLLPNLPGSNSVQFNANWLNGVGQYILGRFENNNTLIGMYQDPQESRDVAATMAKITTTDATISWDHEIYKDARMTATITVVDPDENLDSSRVEYVPVFILVNPGSWNPWDGQRLSPTTFCALMRAGGVMNTNLPVATVANQPIRWYNIYNSGLNAAGNMLWLDGSDQPDSPGTYFIQYPNTSNGHDGRGSIFDTRSTSGVTRVMFWAQETGPDTGVFQLSLNGLCLDLGFNQLSPGDVVVAYYVDPNDFSDMTLATANVEHRDQISVTRFTDVNGNPKSMFWIGRDPVYVQVIDSNANAISWLPERVVVNLCSVGGQGDSEWLVLDEISSNSPVFLTGAGTGLLPVWDALGVGVSDTHGGFQLQLDNWRLEVFNRNTVYVRYNDVDYFDVESVVGAQDGTAFLGDANVLTAFPPMISRMRLYNDISFDLMKVASTEVFDGATTNMWFLNRQGSEVTGYVDSDCVFVMVRDPDQDEDQFRRERISGWWDGGQNWPFGPLANAGWGDCGPQEGKHPFNHLLGYVDIFNSAARYPHWSHNASPNVYLLNPRNGFWAMTDLLETGAATGEFVSVICIDLLSPHVCVPSLDARPGDTIVAFYMDPSSHGDSAMIAIRVGTEDTP